MLLSGRSDLMTVSNGDEDSHGCRRSSSSSSRSSTSSVSYQSSSSCSSLRRRRPRRRHHHNDSNRPPRPQNQLEDKHSETQQQQNLFPRCIRCDEVIVDHYLYSIRDQHWHESCAVCSVCSSDLTDVCFFHDGQLLCRRDYDRLYASRCANCAQPMRSHELCMRTRPPPLKPSGQHTSPLPLAPDDPTAKSLIFHVPCFTCVVCLAPLAAGDAYAIDPTSGRPICRTDYIQSGQETSDQSEKQKDTQQQVTVADQPSPDRDRSAKLQTRGSAAAAAAAKRMRTSLTEEQRVYLQTAYDVNSKPSKSARESLANELSVPLRVVQVWFQNQRARDKRAAVSAAQHSLPGAIPYQHSSAHTPDKEQTSTVPYTPSPRTSEESGSFPEMGGFINEAGAAAV